MKNRLIILATAVFVFSCGEKKKHEDKAEKTKGQEQIKVPSNIISYFKDFSADSLNIEVEQHTQEVGFKPEDCLPLAFLPVFDNKIPQTQSESTGAKPVGKLKLNNTNYFLVLVQQDDYGPIYYGLIYNLKSNKITESEKIAESWGDAGDSQVTYSIVRLTNQKIKIDKYIETCHSELEVQDNKMVATKTECSDSSISITLGN